MHLLLDVGRLVGSTAFAARPADLPRLPCGIQSKPCGILNVRGYFDALICLLEHAVEERFLRPEHRDLIVVESEPEALVEALGAREPIVVDKWLDRQEN